MELSSEKESIKYDDFDKIELKVAEVIECGPVEGADKLLQFRLDAGDAGGHRQILSGIAEWYPDPSIFVGKKVVIVANLKPRENCADKSAKAMILQLKKMASYKWCLHQKECQTGQP